MFEQVILYRPNSFEARISLTNSSEHPSEGKVSVHVYRGAELLTSFQLNAAEDGYVLASGLVPATQATLEIRFNRC